VHKGIPTPAYYPYENRSTTRQADRQPANSLSLIIKQQKNSNMNTTVTTGLKNIVLVHGAFADGSSWARIIPLLQKLGYTVIAVQNPLTSLEDDVAATTRAIASLDGPILLVGHSYGGMVITAAGNDPKVAGLLYVDALIPDDNQSVADVIQPYPPSPGNKEFQQDASGFLTMSFKGIDSYFAQDLPPADRAVLHATQVPWAAKGTLSKISTAAWKSKPSWCIIGLDDQTIPPVLTRAEAKMIHATTLELSSSHVPMLSQPGKVADFIISAAQTLAIK
jgi:pimeloyl-ACP methyl ester carboxylesterase